jgi:hypothetical protein
MTDPLAYIPGGKTPYVTPEVLKAAPTGLSWGTIPNSKSTPLQNKAELFNICSRATAKVDNFCNTSLRGQYYTEVFRGPGNVQFSILPNGVAKFIPSNPPAQQVQSASFRSSSAFPATWSTIASNLLEVEQFGSGGYPSILLAPGYSGWGNGRYGYAVKIQYLAGWSHTSTIAAATAGATTIRVNDITGWMFFGSGTLRDPTGTEGITVTSVTPDVAAAISGSGTLTLATALTYAHNPGTLLSTFTEDIIDAAINYSCADALRRGTASISIQSVHMGGGGGAGPVGIESYELAAEDVLDSYRRVL